MSVVETVLVFVVAPLALYLAVTGLVLAPGVARRPRYRPGRPWRHEPVWFAAPDVAEAVQADGTSGAPALASGSHAAAPALTAGSRRIDTSTDRPGAPSGATAATESDGTLRTSRGGARGTW